MPIVSLNKSNPTEDGRQSQRALSIRTGVERYFAKLSWATLPELSLKTGRRADLVALSPAGKIGIVEVKSSIADYRADQKWQEYLEFCDFYWFATLPDVPADIFPNDTGFMIADNYGCEIARPADEQKMSTARRKSMQMRFARAAALRLSRYCAHFDVANNQFTDVDDEML